MVTPLSQWTSTETMSSTEVRPMSMYETEWRRLGEVFVDSGTIMVVDPCYVLRDKRDNDPEKSLEYCELFRDFEESPGPQDILDSGDFSSLMIPATKQYPQGIHGFVIPSGYGDGAYPVYGRFTKDRSWGTRITGVFIDFDFDGVTGSNDNDEPDFDGAMGDGW